MRTEQEHFKVIIEDFVRAKAFTVSWLITNLPEITGAVHRSDIVATLASTQPKFIADVLSALDKGDPATASEIVSAAIAKLERADPLVLAPQPSRDALIELFRRAQSLGLAGRGNGTRADDVAHATETVLRMDQDQARRWNYSMRHKIEAAEQTKKAS